MSAPAPPPVLSIGCVQGGTATRARLWAEAAMSLSRRVRELREGATSPLALNVVFHVAGEVSSPDFVGVRTGRFDRKASELLVQTAVPDEVPQDRDALLLDLIDEAIEKATEFALRKKLTEAPLAELRRLAWQLRNEKSGAVV